MLSSLNGQYTARRTKLINEGCFGHWELRTWKLLFAGHSRKSLQWVRYVHGEMACGSKILPSDPSIYWTVFTAVVRRNLKVRPLKWKLLRALPSCGTVLLRYKLKVDLSFESANNIIRWYPLNESYWVTFLRVVYRRVGGLRRVDKGGSCASSSFFTLSTLYRSYIDPTWSQHQPYIDPTWTLHRPLIDPCDSYLF